MRYDTRRGGGDCYCIDVDSGDSREMKVLIACEESQAVCIEFRKRGHEAYSCDIVDCSGGHPEWHIKGDVLKVIEREKWDIMIGHPPCTYLSYAGTRYWNDKGRLKNRLRALKFFAALWTAPIEKICLENPAGCASPVIAKYTQMIQPWMFSDTESKRTWLWLKNLPPLEHIKEDDLFGAKTHTKPKIYGYFKRGKQKGRPIYGVSYCKFGEDAGKIRSKTFPGIARAMAEQWG